MSGRVERASAEYLYAVCSDGERAGERVSIELNCRTVFVGQHASELHESSCPLSTIICTTVTHTHLAKSRMYRRQFGSIASLKPSKAAADPSPEAQDDIAVGRG